MIKFKKYALWILGVIAVVLAAALGISYERRKIQALKKEASVARSAQAAAVLTALKESALQREKELEEKDIAIGVKVNVIEDQIEDVRAATKGMSSEDISSEFNSLYQSPR